jgi:phosphopantothenoylcysteine decarboxylase / phosphopantothenate---cysteine ligase
VSNILFILSGSIACYKACDAISRLVQRGHRVRTVATESALRFVGTATLEGLSGEPVGTELFAAGAALDHIALTRWADVTLLCPATANTLNRTSAGLGDDLAGALLLAHDWKKPLLIAPAMNPAMWSHPATVGSVETLRRWGARFIAPATGRTACGEVGEGRLAEPEDIAAALESALSKPERALRVLITSGGTVEPIDGVRVIANTSTGETGALIADHFARRGHVAVLLRARNARRPTAGVREEVFVTFEDLRDSLDRLLANEEVNGVQQAPGAAKLRSEVAPVLRLRRNPKGLDALRRHSRNRAVRIVAFKLTREATPEQVRAAVRPLLASGAADLVVHNDLAAQSSGGPFPADIWVGDDPTPVACSDRAAIATTLESLLLAKPAPAAATQPPASAAGVRMESTPLL